MASDPLYDKVAKLFDPKSYTDRSYPRSRARQTFRDDEKVSSQQRSPGVPSYISHYGGDQRRRQSDAFEENPSARSYDSHEGCTYGVHHLQTSNHDHQYHGEEHIKYYMPNFISHSGDNRRRQQADTSEATRSSYSYGPREVRTYGVQDLRTSNLTHQRCDRDRVESYSPRPEIRHTARSYDSPTEKRYELIELSTTLPDDENELWTMIEPKLSAARARGREPILRAVDHLSMVVHLTRRIKNLELLQDPNSDLRKAIEKRIVNEIFRDDGRIMRKVRTIGEDNVRMLSSQVQRDLGDIDANAFKRVSNDVKLLHQAVMKREHELCEIRPQLQKLSTDLVAIKSESKKSAVALEVIKALLKRGTTDLDANTSAITVFKHHLFEDKSRIDAIEARHGALNAKYCEILKLQTVFEELTGRIKSFSEQLGAIHAIVKSSNQTDNNAIPTSPAPASDDEDDEKEITKIPWRLRNEGNDHEAE